MNCLSWDRAATPQPPTISSSHTQVPPSVKRLRTRIVSTGTTCSRKHETSADSSHGREWESTRQDGDTSTSSVTEKCGRCGLTLNHWPQEGRTGKHRETVPCPHMLAEVIRRLQESRTAPTKTIFEEAWNVQKLFRTRRRVPTMKILDFVASVTKGNSPDMMDQNLNFKELALAISRNTVQLTIEDMKGVYSRLHRLHCNSGHFSNRTHADRLRSDVAPQ